MKCAQDITGKAQELVSLICEAAAEQGVAVVWPMWADGGDGPVTSHFKPTRHVIAGWPRQVDAATPESLIDVGLADWMRRHIQTGPVDGEAGPLQVIALSYDAGLLLDDATRSLWPSDMDLEPAAVVATYDAWLEAESPDGPWRVHGDPDHPLLACVTGGRGGPDLPPAVPLSELVVASEHDGALWRAGFEAIQAGLRAGDFYQVNLARRLVAPLPPQTPEARMWLAFRLGLAMRAAQPTAFGALFPLTPQQWLVSGSPESLLGWDPRTRRATTWPIKGTRPRTSECEGTDAAELRASAKDRAEHTMIVDLMRNDLGRVAEHGSVTVTRLMDALPLTTLHHLVSEVSCVTRPDVDLVNIIEAIFPGGSITGAPRVAAMHAIARLEPVNRGFYCGSLGINVPGRGAVFSILIRTAVVGPGSLRYAVGGGIVVDSEPQAEWDETEDKAAGLRRALKGATS